MRIGFDGSKIMPPRDGIGTYVSSLLEALVKAAPDDQILLYETLHPIDRRIVEQRFGVRPDNLILTEAAAPRPGEVDVFHANGWLRPSDYTGPLLMTCYDLTVLTHGETHRLANRAHCLNGLLDAHRHGDTFLTLAEATARELEHWLEVPRSRIEVVAAAVDSRFRRPSPADTEQALARLGLRPPYVLAVGTREPRKNLNRLLEAWSGLDSELRSEAPLVVVGGSGWEDPDDAERMARAPGVRVVGFVDDALMPALYSAATVFVYPSLAEGFGFPVLEAMACGTPVITSSVSSLPEVAGDAAILVDPLDVAVLRSALEGLLRDPQAASRRSQASLERAARFSWHEVAERLLACYRRLAAEA